MAPNVPHPNARRNLRRQNQTRCPRNPPCQPHCNADCEQEMLTTRYNEIKPFVDEYWDEIIVEYFKAIQKLPVPPNARQRVRNMQAFVTEQSDIIGPLFDIKQAYDRQLIERCNDPNNVPIPPDMVDGFYNLRQRYMDTFNEDGTARRELSGQNQQICARSPPRNPCNADSGLDDSRNQSNDAEPSGSQSIPEAVIRNREEQLTQEERRELDEFSIKYWPIISLDYRRILQCEPFDPTTRQPRELRDFILENYNFIDQIYNELVFYKERMMANPSGNEQIPDETYINLRVLKQMYVWFLIVLENKKKKKGESDARKRDEKRQANRNNRERDELQRQWNNLRQKFQEQPQKRNEGRASQIIRRRNCPSNEPPPPDSSCAFNGRRKRRKQHTAETPKLLPPSWMPTVKPKKKKEFSLTDEQKALVLDNYYPGLIHDAVNQKADFNEIAIKFVTPETAVDGDKAEKGMSLIEAFDTRIKYEQIVLKGLSSLTPDKASANQPPYQPVYGPSAHPVVSDIVLEESVRASVIPVDLQQFIRTIPESDPMRAIACLSRAQQLNDYYKEYKAAQAAANLAPPDQVEQAALFGAKTFKIESLSSETKAVHTDSYKSWELVSYIGITKPR